MKSIHKIFHNTYSAFKQKNIWTNINFYVAILVFIIVCTFDATGTLLGVSETIKKYVPNYKLTSNALLSDTSAILVCSTMCSSPVTSYIESATGIEQGARTGFSSVITAILFIFAIPLFPIFEWITPAVAGSATIFIGSLMFASLKNIEWHKNEMVISSFFIIIVTIITYSLVNGLALGLLAYTLMLSINGKFKEISPLVYIMDVIFIIYFISLGFLPN